MSKTGRCARIAATCASVAGEHEPEILGQAERDPGAAGDQPEVGDRRAEGKEVTVADRIDHGMTETLALQLGEGGTDRLRPFGDRRIGYQPDLVPRLALQHADERGVAHRRQRVVAHARFGEQQFADEEIALVNGPAVLREGRAEHGEIAAQPVEECIGHRADIALIGGIESRAILEQDLPRAVALEPGEGGERLLDRSRRRDGAAFQRDNDRIRIRRARRRIGHVDELDRAHALAHQRVGEIGRAGEIVGDRAEEERHRLLSPIGKRGKTTRASARSRERPSSRVQSLICR